MVHPVNSPAMIGSLLLNSWGNVAPAAVVPEARERAVRWNLPEVDRLTAGDRNGSAAAPTLQPDGGPFGRAIPTEQWQYEPKWDGFRCIVFRDGNEVELQSKSGRPMTGIPGIGRGPRGLKPVKVRARRRNRRPAGGAFSFDALLQRIHPAPSRVGKLATETPGADDPVRSTGRAGWTSAPRGPSIFVGEHWKRSTPNMAVATLDFASRR